MKAKLIWYALSVLMLSLVLLVVSCGGEEKPPSSPSPNEEAKVKAWVIEILLQARFVCDVREGIGDVHLDLLGGEITRDQALNIVEEVREELSRILSKIQSSSLPSSASYERDLRDARDSLAESLEWHIASLESLTTYIECFQPNVRMPSDLEEANKHLQKAIEDMNNYHESFNEAIEKFEQVAERLVA